MAAESIVFISIGAEECIRPLVITWEDIAGCHNTATSHLVTALTRAYADSTNHRVASLPGNPLLFQ